MVYDFPRKNQLIHHLKNGDRQQSAPSVTEVLLNIICDTNTVSLSVPREPYFQGRVQSSLVKAQPSWPECLCISSAAVSSPVWS